MLHGHGGPDTCDLRVQTEAQSYFKLGLSYGFNHQISCSFSGLGSKKREWTSVH